jgi:hypothetical protein
MRTLLVKIQLVCYHLRQRVEFTIFCNSQSRVGTHDVLVVGLYELLGNPRSVWFSTGTPVYSVTKTGRHDIAEILLKVALNTINQ